MTLAEKIYTCTTCKAYSIKIGGALADEFMSRGIEKVIKSNKQKIKHYKSYFYKVLLNVRNDYYSKESRSVSLDKYLEYNEEDNSERNKIIIEETNSNNYKLALDNFLSKDFKNENKKFLQDLIVLKINMSKLCISKITGIRRDKLDEYLNEGNKLIKNEYNKLVNC